MLTLERLQKIRLTRTPPGQVVGTSVARCQPIHHSPGSTSTQSKMRSSTAAASLSRSDCHCGLPASRIRCPASSASGVIPGS